jgi:hypothetical protein
MPGDDDGVSRARPHASTSATKQASARWLGYRFSAPPPTRIWTAQLPCSTLLDASPSTLYTTAKMTKRTVSNFNVRTTCETYTDFVHPHLEEGRHHRNYVTLIFTFPQPLTMHRVRNEIRCISAQAGQEDGGTHTQEPLHHENASLTTTIDHTTRPLRLPVLRKELCQARGCR